MKETYPKNIVNAVVIVLVAIIIAVTFVSCGKKDDLEYKSQYYKNNIVKKI